MAWRSAHSAKAIWPSNALVIEPKTQTDIIRITNFLLCALWNGLTMCHLHPAGFIMILHMLSFMLTFIIEQT